MKDRQALDPSLRPELHHAVRERFRQCVQHFPSQRQAFDLATELLCEYEPQLKPREARSIVARMLATEPMPMPALAGSEIAAHPG